MEVQGHAKSKQTFHGKKQYIDQVMGFCRLTVFNPFTHFMISFTLEYVFIINLVCGV